MRLKRLRRLLLAASATGVIAATPGMSLAQSATPANPGPPPQATFAGQGVALQRVTAPVQMTKDDKVPYRGFGGPSSMLVDPANHKVIVAATAELYTRVCYLMRSLDAGRTWTILPALPAPGTYPYCTSSTAGVPFVNLAWGRNNTLYYALDGYNNADGGNSRNANYSVLLSKSTDLGKSWTTTIVDDNRGKTGADVTHDGPVTGLAVDTAGPKDTIYLGFSRGYPKAPKTSPLTGDNVMVATSTDGGATFAPAVNVNQFAHLTQTLAGVPYAIEMSSFGTPYMAAHNGVVEVVAGANTAFGVTLPDAVSSEGLPTLAARSTDQGRTWTVSAITGQVITPTGAQTGIAWTPKGGPHGAFVIAYAATPNEQDYAAPVIEMQRSTDMGLTWSSPVVLDDDTTGNLYTSFFPQLNVAPNGRVDVIWWDNRRSQGYSYDVYYTYSTNGGTSWAPNVRVTDQPNSFGYGISYGSDVRQPPGVASANDYAAFGWTDTRLATAETQTQDNYSSVAQFQPLPGSSILLPVLAAVFGGLVAAGVALGVVVMLRRRRDTPPPKVESKEPVVAS